MHITGALAPPTQLLREAVIRLNYRTTRKQNVVCLVETDAQATHHVCDDY
jgi:hypothetical protein